MTEGSNLKKIREYRRNV